MTNDIAIKVENLSKVYPLRQPYVDENGQLVNEHWALKDVSFEIKKGESVGIIGPNGSGKSTLLKILAGVTKPTIGKVTISGKVASILEIGAGFHPELSGRENVFLHAQIQGFSKQEVLKVFDEIVAFSGIEKFIDEPVKNYSNGMFLRLAFSIIAHLDFDVYLFDETLHFGDYGFKLKIINWIKTNTNKTILICSHNINELVVTFSYLIEIDEGYSNINKNYGNSYYDRNRLFVQDKEVYLPLIVKEEIIFNSIEYEFLDNNLIIQIDALFKKNNISLAICSDEFIVITTKSMEINYGIDKNIKFKFEGVSIINIPKFHINIIINFEKNENIVHKIAVINNPYYKIESFGLLSL